VVGRVEELAREEDVDLVRPEVEASRVLIQLLIIAAVALTLTLQVCRQMTENMSRLWHLLPVYTTIV
jgi:hypothetical protein